MNNKKVTKTGTGGEPPLICYTSENEIRDSFFGRSTVKAYTVFSMQIVFYVLRKKGKIKGYKRTFVGNARFLFFV